MVATEATVEEATAEEAVVVLLLFGPCSRGDTCRPVCLLRMDAWAHVHVRVHVHVHVLRDGATREVAAQIA